MPASNDTLQVLAYAHAVIRCHKRGRVLNDREQQDLHRFVSRLTHRALDDATAVRSITAGIKAAHEDLYEITPWA